MNSILRYRFVGIVMAALFCVFAIGVPVVLASCPMVGQGGSTSRLSCCPSSFDRTHASLSAYKNTSCCATKIAATRNTQEFVQTCADVLKATGAAFVPVTAFIPSSIPHLVSVSARSGSDASPPAQAVSLPILHLALLI